MTSKYRIMVAAPSNSAADLVTERIVQVIVLN